MEPDLLRYQRSGAALEHQRDAMWVGFDRICLIEASQAIGDAL
ncbi:MAG: hypothetical protein WB696_25100 [Chthoniobacterales bacterium]